MERFTRFQKGSCGFIFGKIVRTVTRETKISGMRNRGNQKLLNKTSGTMKFINIVSSKIDRRRRKKSLFTVRNVFFYKETPSWHHQNRNNFPLRGYHMAFGQKKTAGTKNRGNHRFLKKNRGNRSCGSRGFHGVNATLVNSLVFGNFGTF